jgi:HlyD family secretion protein
MRTTDWTVRLSLGLRHPRMCRTIAAAAVTLGLLSGCSRTAPSKAEGDGASTVPQVRVTHPQKQTIVREVRQPGYLKPYEQTPIYTKIAGYVREVNVDIGDHVAKGAMLAKLYVPEMDRELQVKEARIQQADADLKQAREAVKAAAAFRDAAQARIREADAGIARADAENQRWLAEYDRGKRMLSTGVYDKQTLDESQSQVRASEAARDEARAKRATAAATFEQSAAQVGKAQADVEAAAARVQVAKTECDQWREWLGYAEIRAPFAGVVTVRSVHTGHFLQPSNSGSTSAAAQPLFVLVRTDIMRVTLQVPETDAVLVKEGDRAVVRLQALPGREIVGQVTRFSWSLDDKARTLRTEVHLKNPAGELRPGMYADVVVTATIPDAMALPPESVLTDGDRSYCFQVEDGKAVRTFLDIGVRTPRAVQVLRKQAAAGKSGEPAAWEPITGQEVVVATNAGALLDGQAVRIEKTEKSAAGARNH